MFAHPEREPAAAQSDDCPNTQLVNQWVSHWDCKQECGERLHTLNRMTLKQLALWKAHLNSSKDSRKLQISSLHSL